MWRDAASLLDMLNAARKALEYGRDLNKEWFLASTLHQDAVLRQLTILGKASKRASAECRADHPEVPWRRVAGLRDVVVHAHFQVDLLEVWRIVQEDLPPLVAILGPLVPPEEK